MGIAELMEMEMGRGAVLVSDDETTAWDAVVNALLKHYHEPDVVAARALYAAVAAHDLSGQPVWPMAVAPPSSMKTEIIRALDGLPKVFAVDGVTSKTFISGQIREDTGVSAAPPSSLLHRIGSSGIVLCPDFSTILAIKSDDRKAILGDLRRIYDGQLKKEFGTSDVVPAWKGRITFIACVTPDGVAPFAVEIQRRFSGRLRDLLRILPDESELLITRTQRGDERRHFLVALHAPEAFDGLKDASGDPA